MGVATIKAEKVVETALALLEREVVLPRLVWTDAAGDFRGVKGDTISIRLPAYTKARKNTLRSGDPRTRDNLEERKVDVSLTTRLYKDVEVTDENFTLDILDFTKQVMAPCLRSIVRGYEDEVAILMDGATYEVELTLDEDNPYATFIEARKALNKAQVPQSGRALVVGADVEAFVLLATTFVANLAAAGDVSALRDAQTGRIAGFDVVVSNALLNPGSAFAFHKTAYALNTRAPMVPSGAPWGASMSEGGFAIRAVQVLDPTEIVNILATEAWVGTNVVKDHGTIDEDTGMFEPSEDPDLVNGTDLIFVRAVKISTAGS
jgi:hypothetical protein